MMIDGAGAARGANRCSGCGGRGFAGRTSDSPLAIKQPEEVATAAVPVP